MSAQHTPKPPVMGGWRHRRATIDEANTALAVAQTRAEKAAACDALSDAAAREARRLRTAIAKATGSEA
jgi:hypothetical protein